MDKKVAIVTGSNKGIGFGIVKELLKRNVGVVYLTSRDIRKGEEAIQKLLKENLKAEFHQLDIQDENSVETFANHIKDRHGGVDILINNAGVVCDFNEIIYEDAAYVIDVNYRGNLKVQKHLFPILNENARVINISSDLGHLSNLKNKFWIGKLSSKDLKIDDINDFVDWFLNSVKNRDWKTEDFAVLPLLPYRISKIALCALTIVQQREIDRNISINSLHPGFVQTSMTMNHGKFTVEESAETPTYLALDAPQSLKGAYVFYDKSIVDWFDHSLKLDATSKEQLEATNLFDLTLT